MGGARCSRKHGVLQLGVHLNYDDNSRRLGVGLCWWREISYNGEFIINHNILQRVTSHSE